MVRVRSPRNALPPLNQTSLPASSGVPLPSAHGSKISSFGCQSSPYIIFYMSFCSYNPAAVGFTLYKTYIYSFVLTMISCSASFLAKTTHKITGVGHPH